MPNYVEPASLVRMVRTSRRNRAVGADLALVFMRIAGGVWDRYHFTRDRDDFVQDCCLHLMDSPFWKADTRRHLFNFFTTCAVRFGLKLRKREAAEAGWFAFWCAAAAEYGRPIPERPRGR